jgi:S-adenosylmethionine-diacylglycerol 3-amino-3-carboxypropyl transferase
MNRNNDLVDEPPDVSTPQRSTPAPLPPPHSLSTPHSAPIRYAQCWEDADVLLEGLDVRPGDACFSIASAGDNALALLARSPSRVVALDMNPAQLACVDLRVAAYRELEHGELLELLGSRPSSRREALYARCRPLLTPESRAFWDTRPDDVRRGVGGAGKFEGYFALFRTWFLPMVHPRPRVARLLRGGNPEHRARFYESEWDTWRWRLLFKAFFSRFVMARLGRDPRFFAFVEGDVAGRILERVRHALTRLDPSENPYIAWILMGRHADALPFALRPENFDAIRANLDRLELRCDTLEGFLASSDADSFDRFNLSDVFEYMSAEHYHELLERLARVGRPGARLVYWNMLVPRHRPDSMASLLRPLPDFAASLHARDKAFFYSDLVVEEVMSAESAT